MGKEEIIRYLKKNKGWCRSKEMLGKVKCNIGNIGHHLKQLADQGEILRRGGVRFNRKYEYKFKD